MSKDGAPIVTFEDQQRINAFNKLYSRYLEAQVELKHKKVQVDDLDDSLNELMLQDDETVQYEIGECFYSVDPNEAEEQIQAVLDETRESIEGLEKEVASLKTTMAELKEVLYGKFGNTINLEDE